MLASTLTWQAYGNLGRDPDTWPGRSHYSLHADGSPVIITTALRPCPTFGPQARLEVDGGDGFAIGAGHFPHAARRNVDITYLVMDNEIYGLTKGQYSPTSEFGKVTKSTPYGSVDHPFNPLLVSLGAEIGRAHV